MVKAGREGHLGPARLARRVDPVGFGARIELLPLIRSLAALPLQGALLHLFSWRRRRRRRRLPATSAAEIEVAQEIKARRLETGAHQIGSWRRCHLGDSLTGIVAGSDRR